MIKIQFVGDFFPGGIIVDQDVICSKAVDSLLTDADIRIATLETAVGEGLAFDEEKMANPQMRNIVHTPNRGLRHLKELHIDVVTLANNHAYDLGKEGLLNTIEQLDKLGIKHCGAGRNQEEAASPAVVEIKGKRIAFIGAMAEAWAAAHPAGPQKAGLNLLDMDRIAAHVSRLKKEYDYVVVLPHWGVEYTHWPLMSDCENARRLLDAGADGIFGSHTHQVQPLVNYKGKPIAYSMGNFVFPDFYMDKMRPVWYPAPGEDTGSIPRTLEYPKNPEGTVLRIWPAKNRIGMMVSLTLDGDRMSCNYSLLSLDQNNVLQPCRDGLLRSKLAMIGLLTKMSFYKYISIIQFYGIKRIINKICKRC